MEIPKYLVIDIWLKFKHMPRGTSLKLLFWENFVQVKNLPQIK